MLGLKTAPGGEPAPLEEKMASLGKAAVVGLLLVGALVAGGAAAKAGVAADQALASATGAIWPWPASDSPPLLDGQEDWGAPPKRDEIVMPLGELPPYAGWYRFINAGWYNGGFCLTVDDLALVESDGALLAFDVVTGEQRWQAQYPGIDSFAQPVAAGGMLYIGNWGGICAIRLGDGAELWRREGLTLLAAGPDGVWGCQQSFGEDYVTRATKLEYLAAGDGQARATFSFDPTPLDSLWGAPATQFIALRQDNSIHVYFSDGSSTVLPLHRADWQTACGYLDSALIVGEAAVPASTELQNISEEDYARREQELALDPQTGQPGPGYVLYCYDLPAGRLRWRHEFSAGERDRYYGYDSQISCLEGYAILKGWGGTLALRLADGAVAGEIAALDDEGSGSGGFELLGSAADGLVYIVHAMESGPVLECVPASRLGQPPEPQQRMKVPTELMWNFDITAGRLVGLLETQGPVRGAGANRALVSFELNAQGLPVPGALKVLSAPPLPDALRARFLASPDPLRDPALLREVVSAGTGAVLHIARGVDPGQAAQLNALAAMAAYFDRHPPKEHCGNSSEVLCKALASRAAPQMAPVVVAWLSDPSLSGGQEYALDLLARCGGPVAQHALDALYAAGQAVRHVQPAPPYAFQRAELEQKSEAEYV
jgi:outer membrane protein assembly factor BamB